MTCKVVKSVLVYVACFLVVSTGQAQTPNFAAPVSYNIGTQSADFIPNAAPLNLVTGDFNGDGIIDVVAAHWPDDSVYFLAGNGDGTFQEAVQTAVGDERHVEGEHARRVGIGRGDFPYAVDMRRRAQPGGELLHRLGVGRAG